MSVNSQNSNARAASCRGAILHRAELEIELGHPFGVFLEGVMCLVCIKQGRETILE